MTVPPYVIVNRRSVAYLVEIDPTLPLRGECESPQRGPNKGRVIRLREWDDEVFLHEAMHALIAEGGFAPDLDGLLEEDLVRHLSHGLYAMGWRLQHIGGLEDPRIRERVEIAAASFTPETETPRR